MEKRTSCMSQAGMQLLPYGETNKLHVTGWYATLALWRNDKFRETDADADTEELN